MRPNSVMKFLKENSSASRLLVKYFMPVIADTPEESVARTVIAAAVVCNKR